MTLQEAREQLKECENQITGTYSNLCNEARNMGEGAAQAGRLRIMMRTTFPLILSTLSLTICCQVSHPDWGVILTIVGILIACDSHQRELKVKKIIDKQVKYLNNTLDINSEI